MPLLNGQMKELRGMARAFDEWLRERNGRMCRYRLNVHQPLYMRGFLLQRGML